MQDVTNAINYCNINYCDRNANQVYNFDPIKVPLPREEVKEESSIFEKILYKDNFKSLCFYCPLDWSTGEKEILEATCSTITSNDGHTKGGLYGQFCFETSLLGDPIEASKVARIIANLPEKKEVKEDD